MDVKLQEIEQLITAGETTRALDALNALLPVHPEQAFLLYLKGKAFMKQSQWGKAISQFRQSRQLQPDGPAAEAEDILLEIMEFYNKDMYNQ